MKFKANTKQQRIVKSVVTYGKLTATFWLKFLKLAVLTVLLKYLKVALDPENISRFCLQQNNTSA